MKSLIVLSALFVSISPARAATVNVVVDGQAYNCTPGGPSGGCSCKTFKDGSYFYYRINYEGEEIYRNGSYYNAVDALGACKSKINELSACK